MMIGRESIVIRHNYLIKNSLIYFFLYFKSEESTTIFIYIRSAVYITVKPDT